MAMFDRFAIFHKGGAVLWKKEVVPLKGDPINDLVKTVLLEERNADKTYKDDKYQVKWTTENEMGLVFVMVCTHAVSLLLVEQLLDSVKRAFLRLFKASLGLGLPVPSAKFDFDKDFARVVAKHEADVLAFREKGQKSFEDTALAKDIRTPQQKKEAEKAAVAKTHTGKGGKEEAEEEGDDEDEDPAGGEEPDAAGATGARGAGGTGGTKGVKQQRGFVKKDKTKKGGEGKGDSPSQGVSAAGKKGRASRSWDPVGNNENADGLDRCQDRPEDARGETEAERRMHVGTGVADVDKWEIESDDEETTGKKSKSKGLFAYLQGLTGTRALEREDIDPVLAKFQELLVEKNVAMEIATKLCESVAASLEGKKISGFNGVKNAVKTSLEEGLTRILTPKQNMDILRDCKKANAEGRPYVVVFVGVNGVGKSTSLSKVCFWLKSQKLKVMLAACDTFRSGAVEQLKTHAARLDVPVFEKGYNKDAASIAMDAVKHATQEGYDVVLVDTAGRMQDNEPLMRSLSKLVNLNSPDLVLFVGEALVGNDSIDQVTKFQQALKETAYGTSKPRLIDGILLTKFDTIDDKVGAAVSMVYATGQPVLMVGVGQTYTDLKKLNAANIVKLLLR